MTTTAPRARVIDALTGRKAPTAFFKALSEADDRIAAAVLARADVDDAAEQIGLLLHERDGLLCRVQELEGELAAVRGDLAVARGERDTANARAQVGQ